MKTDSEIREEIKKHEKMIWTTKEGVLIREDKITIEEYHGLANKVYEK